MVHFARDWKRWQGSWGSRKASSLPGNGMTPAMLASFDVSVLISSSESLSNVILESMAAGVPVIATAVGGNPELVKDGETGLLVPPGDERKLVEALANLAHDPIARSDCAGRSREFARAHFHIDEVCKRFEQLYLTLDREKRRSD